MHVLLQQCRFIYVNIKFKHCCWFEHVSEFGLQRALALHENLHDPELLGHPTVLVNI